MFSEYVYISVSGEIEDEDRCRTGRITFKTSIKIPDSFTIKDLREIEDVKIYNNVYKIPISEDYFFVEDDRTIERGYCNYFMVDKILIMGFVGEREPKFEVLNKQLYNGNKFYTADTNHDLFDELMEYEWDEEFKIFDSESDEKCCKKRKCCDD